MITRDQQWNRDKRLEKLLLKEAMLLKKLNKVELQIRQIDKKTERAKGAIVTKQWMPPRINDL